MSAVLGQSPPSWCDAEIALNANNIENCQSGNVVMLSDEIYETRNRDSGCELSSVCTDSPSTYRRIVDDNSTGSYACSSCEATVDQTSPVYQQLTETLAQVRLNAFDSKAPMSVHSALIVTESSIALSPFNPNEIIGEDNIAMEDMDEKKTLERLTNISLPPTIFQESQKVEIASRKSRGRLFPQVLASLALAIAALIEGYSSGYTSPALASMAHPNSTIPVDDHQVSHLGKFLETKF